jgi:hypothetical protein
MNNVAGHLIVMAFLSTVAMAGGLSASLSSVIKNTPGKITVQPYELFNKQIIGGAGGIYEFVNETTDKSQGVCNVDKGKLPSNSAFVFNRVIISFEDAAAALGVGKSVYDQALPGALRNAEFEIVQDGRVVLNLPVAALSNPDPTNGTANADAYTDLGSLFYLTDDLDYTWSFKFPAGAAIAADSADNTNYCEVRLSGYRTIKKAAIV